MAHKRKTTDSRISLHADEGKRRDEVNAALREILGDEFPYHWIDISVNGDHSPVAYSASHERALSLQGVDSPLPVLSAPSKVNDPENPKRWSEFIKPMTILTLVVWIRTRRGKPNNSKPGYVSADMVQELTDLGVEDLELIGPKQSRGQKVRAGGLSGTAMKVAAVWSDAGLAYSAHGARESVRYHTVEFFEAVEEVADSAEPAENGEGSDTPVEYKNLSRKALQRAPVSVVTDLLKEALKADGMSGKDDAEKSARRADVSMAVINSGIASLQKKQGLPVLRQIKALLKKASATEKLKVYDHLSKEIEEIREAVEAEA